MKSPRKHDILLARPSLVSTTVLMLTFAALASGCSGSKGPPDDGDARHDFTAKAQACTNGESAFSICAQLALQNHNISAAEIASLSTCALVSATAITSDAKIFDAAREAVLSTCF